MVEMIMTPRVRMNRGTPPEKPFMAGEDPMITYRRKQLQLDFGEIFG